MINKINRSLLMNTTSVIYDLLAKIGNKHLTNAVSNYLMSAEYVIFRTIYNSEKSNSQTMFSLLGFLGCIVVIPLAVLVTGLVIWLGRKNR